MIGIYLLVTLFTQLSPHGLFGALPAPATMLNVQFDNKAELRVGSAVLLQGRPVGEVRTVTSNDSGSVICTIALQGPEARFLRRGTVALLAAPLRVGAARGSELVVELLQPAKPAAAHLQDGDQIGGYSSYEKFWSADLTQNGISQDAFSVS